MREQPDFDLQPVVGQHTKSNSQNGQHAAEHNDHGKVLGQRPHLKMEKIIRNIKFTI